MFTDALLEEKSSFKKTCQYCSQKIEDASDEQYFEGRVYHKACKQQVVLRKQNPEVFRNVSDIQRATERLSEASPAWKVKNTVRIRIIRRAVNFLLSTSHGEVSHNQLSKGGMTQ